MTKRPRKQQYASEHGDAGINGLQDTGSTPVASTISKQPQAFEIERLRFFLENARQIAGDENGLLKASSCSGGHAFIHKEALPRVNRKGLASVSNMETVQARPTRQLYLRLSSMCQGWVGSSNTA
jgi:hypothetical protein